MDAFSMDDFVALSEADLSPEWQEAITEAKKGNFKGREVQTLNGKKGYWVTMKGARVFVSPGGAVIGGPKALKKKLNSKFTRKDILSRRANESEVGRAFANWKDHDNVLNQEFDPSRVGQRQTEDNGNKKAWPWLASEELASLLGGKHTYDRSLGTASVKGGRLGKDELVIRSVGSEFKLSLGDEEGTVRADDEVDLAERVVGWLKQKGIKVMAESHDPLAALSKVLQENDASELKSLLENNPERRKILDAMQNVRALVGDLIKGKFERGDEVDQTARKVGKSLSDAESWLSELIVKINGLS